MKKLKSVNVLFSIFLLAAFTFTACSNNSSNDGEGNSKDSQEQFNQTVHNFDSSWNQRIETLNASIAQWDSSAKDKSGEVKKRMENKLSHIKKQRDSLKEFLESSQSKSKEDWDNFKESVTNRYKTVVDSINSLSKD